MQLKELEEIYSSGTMPPSVGRFSVGFRAIFSSATTEGRGCGKQGFGKTPAAPRNRPTQAAQWSWWGCRWRSRWRPAGGRWQPQSHDLTVKPYSPPKPKRT
jgi:hypothetical protein